MPINAPVSEPYAQSIPVGRIFLDLANPRHEPYRDEEDVIDYLCRYEFIVELAADILKMGLNPLELFAVIPLSKGRTLKSSTYVIAEGNRRLCALKLLHDPDLAPADYRKEFTRLAASAQELSELPCVVFQKKEEVAEWLERIHGGAQGGIGRRQWNAEQKNRHLSDKRYQIAQKVLDYAQKRNFITAKDRRSRLTTAQRYLGNPVMRDALGLDVDDAENLNRTRPSEEFDILLHRFTDDLTKGVVSSRSKSDDVQRYARTLASVEGISGRRVNPEPFISNGRIRKRPASPKEPRRPEKISYNSDIAAALEAIPSYKLGKIYYSLCSLNVDTHTPLLSVGLWSFFEALTSLSGRNFGTSFEAFLSKNRLQQLGLSAKEDINSTRQIIERIASYGNTDKHHDKSATFNGEQLANDVYALQQLICKLAYEATTSTTGAAS